jgi:energy-coupling factor transporter ATP-binding protein EcfA2
VQLWRELSVEEAEFDPKGKEYKDVCLPHTRVELIQQVKDWANDSAGENIFWLTGMAGTGKSTIARSLARIFHQEGRLGASFFFKRGGGDRGNDSRLCMTLAAQLALNIPILSREMTAARDNKSHASLESQFKTLICEPLRHTAATISQFSTNIILIDALDECKSEDLKKLPKLLAEVGELTARRIRIFVTSRPELPIILGFKDTADIHYTSHHKVALHEIPEEMIGRDMLIYF